MWCFCSHLYRKWECKVKKYLWVKMPAHNRRNLRKMKSNGWENSSEAKTQPATQKSPRSSLKGTVLGVLLSYQSRTVYKTKLKLLGVTRKYYDTCTHQSMDSYVWNCYVLFKWSKGGKNLHKISRSNTELWRVLNTPKR